MKQPVLSIIGPTAVGKTAFANEVARWLSETHPEYTGVDFFSADSRQMYQGLEIISGAELPEKGQFQPYTFSQLVNTFWQSGDGRVQWFGVSSLKLDQEWSVSHFQKIVQEVLPTSWATKRLPIIVGGTGLYVNHALETDSKLHVPPNAHVREKAEVLSLEELQSWLQTVAPTHWAAMNTSDQANPRRLVRAIEIALFQPTATANNKVDQSIFSRKNMLIVGLQADFEHIENKIRARVYHRWNHGALAEVERLLADYPNQKLPIFSATGVKPVMAYLSGQATLEPAQDKWFTQERQYAKRQITWWKKVENVVWFDIDHEQWQQNALTKIDQWLA